ncbi:MAG TPA: hypothetical protein VN253_03745 [Kofleriaceae bacterium]|nr:hypothetical protein [Kofleriaceae bacterium]
MPKHHNDELPSIDLAALEAVTGGAGDASSMMMPMMMMMRNRQSAAAAPPPPAAPQKPKIMLNGVEQPASALTSTGNGSSSFETTV